MLASVSRHPLSSLPPQASYTGVTPAPIVTATILEATILAGIIDLTGTIIADTLQGAMTDILIGTGATIMPGTGGNLAGRSVTWRRLLTQGPPPSGLYR